MSFSNPASGATAAAAGYVRSLLDLLGDRDPFAVHEELVPALRAALAGLADADRRRPEAPGKWSVLDVVRHLADSEIVYAYRLRLVLAADSPPIPGYDQDRWAAALRYRDASSEESLDELAALRRGNLRLLRALSPEEWERSGVHAERGVESVRRLFRLMAAHDLVHRRQIDRIKHRLGLG